jgi:hypothetical protein
MSIFGKLFKKDKAENAYYSKLSKSLLKKGFTNKIRTAYRLVGIPNSFENLNRLRKAILENSFNKLRNTIPFDVMRDNLELYFVEDDKNECYLVILLDPYELLESEQILEIIPTNKKSFGIEPEIIYQLESEKK